ncbi:hypothetical protein QUH71_02265 [Priestia aryabhattai]|uniref:hypothetical protein n=1 Tax=Priestia aryabhattai TaxID=412384 RepID=UPI0025A421F1|nr:hypothetical protein [Priestia aryabhattai]WJN45328.1 hypothetical protein QUH71_02265 [Priestia aryabhattai]
MNTTYEETITALISREQSEKAKAVKKYMQKHSIGKISNADVVRTSIEVTYERFICYEDISKENSELKQKIKLLEDKNSELEKKLNIIGEVLNQ